MKTEASIPRKAAYTIKEAANYIGVHQNSIRNLIARGGLLRTSKAFRKVLILGEDVETLLERTS